MDIRAFALHLYPSSTLCGEREMHPRLTGRRAQVKGDNPHLRFAMVTRIGFDILEPLSDAHTNQSVGKDGLIYSALDPG
jgi:hypothetical protein